MEDDKRYTYYFTPGPKVICVTHYAGKKVRAVAICSDDDEYDIEVGKKLAKARVDYIVASRRSRRAKQKVAEASKELAKAKEKYGKAALYRFDAVSAEDGLYTELVELERALGKE